MDTPTDTENSLPSTTSSSAPREQLKRLHDVSALVARLLRHYWTADDDPATRQAQIEDWIDDLGEFPSEIVEEACRMWRRANKHRPTPAEIRSLALAENAYRQPVALLPPNEPGRYVGPEGRCQDRWSSCAERWRTRGFVCQASCRAGIPDYRALTETEAFKMFGKFGLPGDTP